jgi:hypothetical protein
MLSLRVNGENGKVLFTATNARNRQSEDIELSQVATPEILQELDKKSGFNAALGDDWVLTTVTVNMMTKHFIVDCWDELKKLKPQLGIR